jgi:hypothetical protein
VTAAASGSVAATASSNIASVAVAMFMAAWPAIPSLCRQGLVAEHPVAAAMRCPRSSPLSAAAASVVAALSPGSQIQGALSAMGRVESTQVRSSAGVPSAGEISSIEGLSVTLSIKNSLEAGSGSREAC